MIEVGPLAPEDHPVWAESFRAYNVGRALIEAVRAENREFIQYVIPL
jgi:hypothetical protein